MSKRRKAKLPTILHPKKLPHAMPEGCSPDLSGVPALRNRVCERGTHGCVVRHMPIADHQAEAVHEPPPLVETHRSTIHSPYSHDEFEPEGRDPGTGAEWVGALVLAAIFIIGWFVVRAMWQPVHNAPTSMAEAMDSAKAKVAKPMAYAYPLTAIRPPPGPKPQTPLTTAAVHAKGWIVGADSREMDIGVARWIANDLSKSPQLYAPDQAKLHDAAVLLSGHPDKHELRAAKKLIAGERDNDQIIEAQRMRLGNAYRYLEAVK